MFAACQDPAPKGSLIQQLQAVYVATVMQPNGLKVAIPGCTLTVQLDGLMANPVSKIVTYYANTFEDGQVIGGKKGLKAFLPGRDKLNLGNARALAAGEKVYLMKIEIQDNSIVFYLQSCGSCDPAAADPAHKPYRASVDVRFQKGFLGITDLKHVEQTVGAILAFPDANADNGTPTGGQQAQQPSAAAQQAPAQVVPPLPPPPPEPARSFEPIKEPPPPAPSAPPAQIEKGQTIEQVIAALGQPETIADGAGKKIYLFKVFKITFVNGKVADVDLR